MHFKFMIAFLDGGLARNEKPRQLPGGAYIFVVLAASYASTFSETYASAFVHFDLLWIGVSK